MVLQAFYRNICFTSYRKMPPVFDDKKMSYLVYGDEICPTTGRQHWQGYMELKRQQRKEWVLKHYFGPNPDAEKQDHFEARRASPSEAAIYCKKKGKFQEFGELSHQGKRSDFVTIATAIAERTMTISEIAEEKPALFTQYHRGFKALENETRPRSKFEHCHVEIWWGETGLGKTRAWFDVHREDGYLADDMEWWCSYRQEKFVCFDEFDCTVKLTTMLKWLDGYPRKLNCKGGSTSKNWNHVVIISNTNPLSWYSNVGKEKKNAFARRINKVVHFTKEGNIETVGLEFDYSEHFVSADKLV